MQCTEVRTEMTHVCPKETCQHSTARVCVCVWESAYEIACTCGCPCMCARSLLLRSLPPSARDAVPVCAHSSCPVAVFAAACALDRASLLSCSDGRYTGSWLLRILDRQMWAEKRDKIDKKHAKQYGMHDMIMCDDVV